ncbi:MAG TPA: pilin [Candidatus Saccharimonadales bacterium]|jgi:hypothetical protein|nr:pilin [Candidatus Saccharimonadales bacterium]
MISQAISNPIFPTQNTSAAAGVSFLQSAIPYAIEWGFIIGAVVFFFMLLIGAIKWISSGGDKQKVEDAKGTLTNAFIGLVILFAVFAILGLLDIFFNINLLKFTIPTLSNSSGSGGNTCSGFVCQGPTHCEMSGGPHCVNN